MKKLFVALMLLAITLLSVCGCAKTEENVDNGYVTFYAIDGFSGLPLENVRIVLPENECELITGTDGRSEKAQIKVIKNAQSPFEQEYGTFTVLAYKEEYNEYALIYAQIKKEQEREIKIYMFKKETPLSNGAPLATIESPPKEWVKELIEAYR